MPSRTTPPSPDDPDLRETLDLLSQLVASLSDRVDRQATALDRLAEAQETAQAHLAAASPDRIAATTAKAVREALVPHLLKIVSTMEELNGGKAILRERLRAFDREEARQGRWRFQPWAVVVGIPLVLVTVLALLVPRAAAQTSLTCRATGGTWYEATERYDDACMYPKERWDVASGS